MGTHRRTKSPAEDPTGAIAGPLDLLCVLISRVCPEGHLVGMFMDTMQVEIQIWCAGCSVFYHGMAPEFTITTQIAERTSARALVQAANNFTHWTPEPEKTRDLPAA